MVDISNKALALVLVAAVFVSLGGTMVSLNKIGQLEGITGFATEDTGIANITILSDLSIQFKTTLVDFGAGFTNDTSGGPPLEYCDMSTNGTDASSDVDCAGFNDGLGPLELENVGNTVVNVLNLSFDQTAATFLGGTAPVLSFATANNETGSCGANFNYTDWTTVAVQNFTICTQFNDGDTQDVIDIHLNVSVPQDAPPATNTQMTVTAYAVS